MGIFDWLFGKKETPSELKKDCCSKEVDERILYWDNGNLRGIINFKNDKSNGPCKFYDENGEIEQEGFYINGKEVDLWKFYHENGNLHSEYNFVDGKKDGPFKEYNLNGNLMEKGVMKNNEVSETEHFDEEGNQVSIPVQFRPEKDSNEYELEEDQTNGLVKTYYENGEVEYEGKMEKKMVFGNPIMKMVNYSLKGIITYEKNIGK
tara:strand:- start:296 stop:913 length:618 start_codon:yes stop_codon:yes gene_type:complete